MLKRFMLIASLALPLTLVAGAWAQLADESGPAEPRPPRPPAEVERAEVAARPEPPRTRRPPRLAPEDVDEALEVLGDYRPELADKISEWAKQDPEKVASLIQEHMPWIQSLITNRRQDPDGYRLRLQDMRLEQRSEALAKQVGEARQASARNVARLEAELRKVIDEHFEVRQQIRQHNLARLERAVETLRRQLSERHDTRQTLTDAQFKRLLGEERRGRNDW
jgi:hypothetical protein